MWVRGSVLSFNEMWVDVKDCSYFSPQFFPPLLIEKGSKTPSGDNITSVWLTGKTNPHQTCGVATHNELWD